MHACALPNPLATSFICCLFKHAYLQASCLGFVLWFGSKLASCITRKWVDNKTLVQEWLMFHLHIYSNRYILYAFNLCVCCHAQQLFDALKFLNSGDILHICK